ncbi:D-alanyl-D-alanine carboxypeptidase family protein [Corynebacterium uterequi]|uniref:D-alanyl-D-alanine carboxypeptidase n=1 Tax=Corynebacterium uterequi TaxID=1072256 RepID=A0A0G3HET3_9CORY|nr:serine hydrolase [Corynebacterium uterequi]AKK10483.1 D-alanyl-D-alanine carboxypeptidase [Corynebacterium uterequi]
MNPLPLVASALVMTTLVTTTPYAPPPRSAAPNTDSCPHSLVPPEPVTTSERLAPGRPSPEPLAPIASTCGVSAPAGFDVPEMVLASAWLVFDVDSGEIIAMKDPHGRYRPASIIKALVALVAIRELPLDRKVTVSAESAAQEGSAVGLVEGGVYTVEELLYGLILNSGNDAAHALAQELGGDEATLAAVNALAAELGTGSTRVAHYAGLDAPGQSTSAYDMGLIFRAAFSDPVFARIAATEFVNYPEQPGYEAFEVWNDNKLFLNDPDGIGGKTGYTDDAKHTFVGALDRDGRRLAAVVLDTTIDQGRAWEQAQALLHEAYTIPAGSGVATLQPLAGASAPEATTDEPLAALPAVRHPVVGIAVVIGVVGAFAVAAAVSIRRARRR